MHEEILTECEDTFKKIDEKQDTTNAIVFSIKDNDLKHLAVGQAKIEGSQQVILIILSGLFVAVIGLIIRLVFG